MVPFSTNDANGFKSVYLVLPARRRFEIGDPRSEIRDPRFMYPFFSNRNEQVQIGLPLRPRLSKIRDQRSEILWPPF